jgi:hypothetical protein
MKNKEGLLRFNLEDFDARESFQNAMKADNYRLDIATLYDTVFRPILKYNQSSFDLTTPAEEEEVEIVRAIWEKVYKHFEDNGIE